MTDRTISPEAAAELVAQVDVGARNPVGWERAVVIGLAFAWSLFQLYIASPLPFWLQANTGLPFVVPGTDARLFHLAFGLALAALAYPLMKSGPTGHIPWYDWLLAAAGVWACLYINVFRDEIATRAGLPTTGDMVISSMGMLVLAVAVWRALGLPLLIVASVFVLYVFFGDAAWLPDAIQWKGASFGKATWHYWMQNEGVFGVALGVSASLIFLFVLFGAILEKAGAGNYFVKIAFALLGHLRGGPAKASVIASAMSGLYSGSSIANTVTTGTFTIPLMKKTGFSAEKAGAVEVASSTNGQLTPPVMGAAAFLIAEFTGVQYSEIIKHAALPALISYIALIWIVHLEAMKLGLKGLPRAKPPAPLARAMLGFLTGFLGGAAVFGLAHWSLGWVKDAAPGWSFHMAIAICFAAYVGLVALAARKPDLVLDDPNAPILELPDSREVAVTGFYYLIPIVILIWSIVVERLSPGLSAFWATMAMLFVAFTQHALKLLFRGGGDYQQAFARGARECFEGMVAGARNMIGIAIATGAAGVIVGTISLTGAHQVVGGLVEYLSGGSLIAMLLLVAVMSLILGMGLPTTANYIVVSSLMAPVIVTLGAANGLVLPLIAVHLFVFYFGILADDTPPVGLAAYAAAAISRGDPIKTGVQGFTYDIRTALLPFLFVFNTDLLLIDVGFAQGVAVFATGVIAMLLFASATQGFLFVRNRWWETVAMLLIAFTLFRPGYWLDRIEAEFAERPGAELTTALEAAAPGEAVRLTISGPDWDDLDATRTATVQVTRQEGVAPSAILEDAGLVVTEQDGAAVLEEPMFGTPNEKLGTMFDFYGDDPVTVETVSVRNQRPAKEWFYIPALVALAGLLWAQKRRAAFEAE